MTSRIVIACCVAVMAVQASSAQTRVVMPTSSSVRRIELATPQPITNPASVTSAAPPVSNWTQVAPAPTISTWSRVDNIPAPVPTVVPSSPMLSTTMGASATDDLFWITGEYLLTWVRGLRVPPLVTTSPEGTPRTQAGVLQQPTTSMLFGDTREALGDIRSGLRVRLGCQLCPECGVGLESGFRLVESLGDNFNAQSTGSPILARPFTNALDQQQQSLLVAFPNSATGAISARVSSGNFYDAWVDLSKTFVQEEGYRFDGLLGYRFFRYDDTLQVRQVVDPIDGSFVPGTRITTLDDFATQNEFHGVDLGLRAQCFFEQFSVNLLGKLAVGNLRRTTKIDGTQLVNVPGLPQATQQGGVLALSSNIGQHTENVCVLVPEVNATFRWHVTDYFHLSLGYSFLVIQDIYRAGDQVNLNLNPNLLPAATTTNNNPAQPAFTGKGDSLWIQSINFGGGFCF